MAAAWKANVTQILPEDSAGHLVLASSRPSNQTSSFFSHSYSVLHELLSRPIGQVIDDVNRVYFLPAIQRPFVWSSIKSSPSSTPC